jgi:hypothetical protein
MVLIHLTSQDHLLHHLIRAFDQELRTFTAADPLVLR